MQATARLRYLMMSPRKIRRVVPLIKGKSVEEALAILKFTNKRAALPLAKTIQSATANALHVEGTSRLKAEDLSVVQVNVDEGPRAKRIMFRAMGRAYRFKKRFAHITVVVEGEPSAEAGSKRKRRRKAADEEAPIEKSTKKTARGKAEAAAVDESTPEAVDEIAVTEDVETPEEEKVEAIADEGEAGEVEDDAEEKPADDEPSDDTDKKEDK